MAQDFVLDGVNLAAIPLASVKPRIDTECVVSGWGVTDYVSTRKENNSQNTKYVVDFPENNYFLGVKCS